MCGRYSMFSSAEKIHTRFNIDDIPQDTVSGDSTSIKPRYNITPMQNVLAITAEKPRRLQSMQWGLLPSWAKDKSMSAKMFNARAETILEKPSFRTAFAQRRCLVLANGFYEWEKKTGQPYYVSLSSGECFAMAGLWETWQDPTTKESMRSCTVITTEPNSMIAPYHHRMAVILQQKDEDIWLDHTILQDRLLTLLRPYPAEELQIAPVSKLVGNIHHDSPDLIHPIDLTQARSSSEHSVLDDLQLF